MTRIAITGGPRTGKTTTSFNKQQEWIRDHVEAWETTPVIRHTDDLIHLGWSEASEAAASWFDSPGPWIIEGVAVSRALRKWRERNPGKPPPVDEVYYLSDPHVPLNPGQATMAKGVRKVHDEIEPWLRKHGVIR